MHVCGLNFLIDWLIVKDLRKSEKLFQMKINVPKVVRFSRTRFSYVLGIRVSEKYGGSNLAFLDSSIIYEALSTGCTSTAAFLTIHKYVLCWLYLR